MLVLGEVEQADGAVRKGLGLCLQCCPVKVKRRLCVKLVRQVQRHAKLRAAVLRAVVHREQVELLCTKARRQAGRQALRRVIQHELQAIAAGLIADGERQKAILTGKAADKQDLRLRIVLGRPDLDAVPRVLLSGEQDADRGIRPGFAGRHLPRADHAVAVHRDMQRRAHAVDQLADHGICAHLHAHIDGEIDLIGIAEGSAQARELLFAEVDVVIRDRHAAPVQRQDGRPGLRDLQAVAEGSELILQISRQSRVSGGLLREQIKVLQRAELTQHFAEGGIGIGLGNAVRRDAVDLVRDAGQRELQLLRITHEWGVETEGKDIYELAHEMAEIGLMEYGKPFGVQRFLKRAPEHTQELWHKAEIEPRAIDREVATALHMTHMGCSSLPEALIRQALRSGLSDGWGGSMMGTEFSDVMFGTPKPVDTTANIGVMEKDMVNIVVHGHDPSLSEMIVYYANDPEMIALAKSVGAKGINICGVCCTANEVAMRHGIPMAGNFLQQENVVLTGACEAIVVDVQCIFPALGPLSKCFHTKFVTTSPIARMPDSDYIEFHEETPLKTQRQS